MWDISELTSALNCFADNSRLRVQAVDGKIALVNRDGDDTGMRIVWQDHNRDAGTGRYVIEV